MITREFGTKRKEEEFEEQLTQRPTSAYLPSSEKLLAKISQYAHVLSLKTPHGQPSRVDQDFLRKPYLAIVSEAILARAKIAAWGLPLVRVGMTDASAT